MEALSTLGIEKWGGISSPRRISGKFYVLKYKFSLAKYGIFSV